jgi:hypothetical protein
MGTERDLERREERIRRLREQGFTVPDNFHFTAESRVGSEPTREPSPEPRPREERPTFTPEQRRLRQERGLPVDRHATLEELKAVGPPRQPLETDPAEIARARRDLRDASIHEGFAVPGAALLTEAFQRFALRGDQEIQRRTRERREAGEGFLGARTEAFRESDLPSVGVPFTTPRKLLRGEPSGRIPIGVKGALEAVSDPTILIPVGTTAKLTSRAVASQAVKKGVTAAPKIVAAPSARATAFQATKKSLDTGELSDEFVFHVGSSRNAKGLVDEGLQSGGYTSSPLAEQGYGDVVYVFRKSDLPPTLNRNYEADVIYLKEGVPGAKAPFFTNAQAPKPVAAFTWKELGRDVDELPLGARAAEEGVEVEPPLSELLSPEDLARVRAEEQARDVVIRGEIAQAFRAAPKVAREAGGTVPQAAPPQAVSAVDRAQQLMDAIDAAPRSTLDEAIDLALTDIIEVTGSKRDGFFPRFKAKGAWANVSDQDRRILGSRFAVIGGAKTPEGAMEFAKFEAFDNPLGIRRSLDKLVAEGDALSLRTQQQLRRQKSEQFVRPDLANDVLSFESNAREALIATGKFDLPGLEARAAPKVAREVPEAVVPGEPTRRPFQRIQRGVDPEFAAGRSRRVDLIHANFREANRFLRENVQPAFLEKFGESPAMRLQRQADGEQLLEIIRPGWDTRAKELGLEFIKDKGSSKLYRIPGMGQQALAAPKVIEAIPPEAIVAVNAARTAETAARLPIPPTKPTNAASAPRNAAYLPELPTVEQVLAVNFKEDWGRAVGQRLSRVPVVGKQAFEQANPSVMAMDRSHQGIIAYQTLRDSGESATAAAMAPLDELRNTFQVDELGKVLNVNVPKGTSPYIQDVLTFPGAYPLSPAQLEYASRAKGLLDKSLAQQIEAGVKVKPIMSFDDAARKISLDVDIGEGRYFPRIPTGKVVKDEAVDLGRAPVRGAIGATQTQAKHRSWPSARESIEQGNNVLLADPTETMRITLSAGRRAIADKRLADFTRKQPGVNTRVERLKQQFPEVVRAREQALFAERNRVFAVNALRRAIRGQPQPPGTMERLSRDFPDIVEDIRRVEGRELSERLTLGRPLSKLDEVEDLSKRRIAEANAAYQRGLQRTGVAPDPVTEATLDQPAFRGLIIPKQMAEQINTHLLDQAPEVLQKISNFNDVLRMLETGLDPGFILIQGAIPLMFRPQRWAKAVTVTAQSLSDPAVAARYFQLPENRAIMTRMVDFGSAPLSSSEFVTGAGVLGQLPGIGPAFRRGADLFNTYLDVSRIEMHKALGAIAGDDDAYRQLTNSIDQMLGVTSTRQLGVTPTRRAVEGALLAYAPRYRRAGASFIASIIRGGVRGQVARKALAHFVFGSMAFMTSMAVALGQFDLLDPEKGKNGIPPMYDIRFGRFLSVRIGDSYVGVGGVTVSSLRLLANISRGLSDDGVKGAASTAFRSFRGLTSPFSSDVLDLATGKAGFTEEDTRTPMGIARMAARDVLPFYVEPFATGAIDKLEGAARRMPGVEAFVTNLIGTREREITPFERRSMQRDALAESSDQTTLEGEPVREWLDMNRAQQKEAERASEELQQLALEIEDSNFRRASKNKRDRLTAQRDERENFEAEMTKNAHNLAAGVAGMSRWRYDKERSRIRAEHRGATGMLWVLRGLSEAGAVADFEKWVRKNQRPEDAALDAYFERRAKLEDAIPVLDSRKWEAVEAALSKWLLNTYGSPARDYVLDHKDDWILDLPELARNVEQFRAQAIQTGSWLRRYRDQSLGGQIQEAVQPAVQPATPSPLAHNPLTSVAR